VSFDKVTPIFASFHFGFQYFYLCATFNIQHSKANFVSWSFFFACLTKNGNKCVAPLCQSFETLKKLFVFIKNTFLCLFVLLRNCDELHFLILISLLLLEKFFLTILKLTFGSNLLLFLFKENLHKTGILNTWVIQEDPMHFTINNGRGLKHWIPQC
jgi:hypothetical protein